jgi:hypothetical protein
MGIGIPKSTRLYQVLEKSGVHLSKVPITSEEATQILKEVLNRD